MTRVALSLAVWVVCACGGGGKGPDGGGPTCETKQSLIDAHAWTLVSWADDPFAAGVEPAPDAGPDAGATGPTVCTEADQRYEDFGGEDSWTVYTIMCNWATVEQPSLVAVEPGEALKVRVWYFSQLPTVPAEAHVMVARQDETIWSDVLPIPVTTGGLLFRDFTLDEPMPAGTPVRFHIDNHGSNSWNFLELSVTKRVPCSSLDAG